MTTSEFDRALELRREAVGHKRLSASHRRLARQRMEELRAICRHLGLTLVEVDRVLGISTEGEAHGRTEADTAD